RHPHQIYTLQIARMAELVDATVSKTVSERSAGSSPASGTTLIKISNFILKIKHKYVIVVILKKGVTMFDIKSILKNIENYLEEPLKFKYGLPQCEINGFRDNFTVNLKVESSEEFNNIMNFSQSIYYINKNDIKFDFSFIGDPLILNEIFNNDIK